MQQLRQQQFQQQQQQRHDQMWEKCARLFLLNTPRELDELENYTEMILTNILNNPIELKYRKIKLSNKFIHSHIASKAGGIEFFTTLGFIKRTEDDEKILQLEKLTSIVDQNQEIHRIQTAMKWLNNTILTCKNAWQLKITNEEVIVDKKMSKDVEDIPCCECVISIRLPIGTTVLGGFMKGDKLLDIRNYARSYFTMEKMEEVQICQPHDSRAIIDEKELAMTLNDAELYPRAMIIATCFTKEVRQLVVHEVIDFFFQLISV